MSQDSTGPQTSAKRWPMTGQRSRAGLAGRLPVVAIGGRPNVGKSTLFNRITGQRRAIVGDEPGITRDRIYAPAEWRGRWFEVVDTGGMVPGSQEAMAGHILRQARVALEEAAQVVMVVDGRAEITATDRELARLLLRTGKPLVLAVNKADAPHLVAGMQEWHSLGIGRVFFISAESGLGLDDLLDEVTAGFPEASRVEDSPPGAEEIRVAIIGRPNVGKSTLLNRLAEKERAIVSPTPGTTRDAVDLVVERDGARFRLVDTAGIRRRSKTKLMAEKLSVVMARRHIRMCDVALLLVDPFEGVTALDTHIAGYAHQSGRGVIVVVNKWDAVQDRRQRGAQLTRQVREAFKFMDYAPVLFLSAETGMNVPRLVGTIREVGEACRRRIPTAELNRFFETVDFERATQPAGRKAKVLYLTQAGVRPPTFVLFTNRPEKLHFSFERFLENQIRRHFGFTGTPLVIKTKARRERR